MKRLFIVANWKSNKTETEAKDWFQIISSVSWTDQISNKEIVVCPSFTLLHEVKSLITNYQLPITIGAQDISSFTESSYTGEINGRQIKEFADYVIIGHSERRSNFLESDDMLIKKIEMAESCGLSPIFCVQDENTVIPGGVKIVAYEPLFAIGTGNPDSSENANIVAGKIKNKNKTVQYVLYGGSVISKNVNSFTQMSNVDGILVGSASLDASEFLAIIKNA